MATPNDLTVKARNPRLNTSQRVGSGVAAAERRRNYLFRISGQYSIGYNPRAPIQHTPENPPQIPSENPPEIPAKKLDYKVQEIRRNEYKFGHTYIQSFGGFLGGFSRVY